MMISDHFAVVNYKIMTGIYNRGFEFWNLELAAPALRNVVNISMATLNKVEHTNNTYA